ncbi:MAG TPA: alpha/beta hydrolase [Pyrinomonadaceae bacterium]|nr:alpha/beta hydrolase [Pyrinomonadaceae bacterium]
MKDELSHAIANDLSEPVIGLGHSLGGILHLLVSVERPELYRRIILLDSPIISRRSSSGIRVMKALNLMDRFSMSRQTRGRRNFWISREAAYEHFKSKPKFSRFDDDVLRDYIRFGTTEVDGGYSLFFEPKVEAAIYRNLPHNLPSLRGKLNVPVAYIGGSHSREARLARLSFMQRHFDIDFHFLPASHLFPFEKPTETAALLSALLHQS